MEKNIFQINSGRRMKIPCKNCLVLSMCRSRKIEVIDYSINRLFSLYRDCSLFRDYYNFYVSQYQLYNFEKETIEFFESL